MKVCVPIDADYGLQSELCAHFGSAPAFMIVDTESGSSQTISNQNQHHAHGRCMPLEALQGEQIDAMIVAGIGQGALSRLEAASIQIFLSEPTTVEESLAASSAGTLPLMQPGMACAGHGHH